MPSGQPSHRILPRNFAVLLFSLAASVALSGSPAFSSVRFEPASLDLIVYESGELITIDQTDVDPDDDLLVQGVPPDMLTTTYLSVTDVTVVQSITLAMGGSTLIEDSTQVIENVTVGNGGGCHLQGFTNIGGRYEVRAGGGASCSSTGTIGSVRVDQGGDLTSLHLATVLGDVTLVGKANLGNATIQGATSFLGSRTYRARGTSFEGPVELTASADVDFIEAACLDVVRLTDASRGRFVDSTLGTDLVLEDTSHARLLSGMALSGVLDLRDSSSAGVIVLSANYPDGAIQDLSGVITGTDLNGAPLSIPFVREAGTELVVALHSSNIGTTFCAQPFPNALGLFARLVVTGSDLAAANYLQLTVSDLPQNSFGYFVVGTQPGLLTVPAGGELCVGGNVGRFVGPGQIMHSGSSGTYTLSISGLMPGLPATAVVPGSTYIFQSWNREPFLNPPHNYRFSDAVSVLYR